MDQSTMQYLDVYNAGNAGGVGAVSTFRDARLPPLDMQHVTFYSLQANGLRVLTGGFTPSSRVLVNNYGAEVTPGVVSLRPVLKVSLGGASTVDDQVFQVGATVPDLVRYVVLDNAGGEDVDIDVTLHKLAAGLRWQGDLTMASSASPPPLLTLLPGVIFAIEDLIAIGNGGFTGGDISAVGTADEPIRFTSTAFARGNAPMPGDYEGILFYPGTFTAASKFDHVIFEYGGASGETLFNCNDNRSDIGGEILFTDSLGSAYMGPPITNSRFSFSAGNGIRSRCNGTASGCLTTDYTIAGLMNTFDDIANVNQDPLGCP
jgi:hypothetical protein